MPKQCLICRAVVLAVLFILLDACSFATSSKDGNQSQTERIQCMQLDWLGVQYQ